MEWVLFFPSRLDPRKGPLVALEALRHLRESRGRGYLVYVGRGQLEAALRKEIDRLHMRDYVALLGMVDREAMADLYAVCDLVLVPSVPVAGYPEPLANCILEGFASGRCVIASDAGGSGDVISHGDTGILVPPGDSLGLSEAIQNLMEEPSRKEALENRALQWIRNQCSPERVAQKLTGHFQGVEC